MALTPSHPVPGTAHRATRDCRPRCSPRSRTRRCPVSAVRLLAGALAVRSTSAHRSPGGANYQACASRSSAIQPGWRTPLFFCVCVDRSMPYHNVCDVLSDVGATNPRCCASASSIARVSIACLVDTAPSRIPFWLLRFRAGCAHPPASHCTSGQPSAPRGPVTGFSPPSTLTC